MNETVLSDRKTGK